MTEEQATKLLHMITKEISDIDILSKVIPRGREWTPGESYRNALLDSCTAVGRGMAKFMNEVNNE